MRADPVFNFEFQGGHVISRNSQGETVSTYGDLIWDFYPYRGPNRTRYNKINFQLVRPDFVSELKYLMGIIIYGKCSRNVDHLKAATIQGHFATLKKVAKFAGSKQLKVADVFCDTQVLVEFLRTNLGANDINSLTSIYKSLSRIENLAFGFSEIEHKSREVLTLAFKETKKNNQTPVIPERLLSNLISELGILFSNVSDYEDRLHAFIDKSLEDKCYAKHLTVQRRLGLCMSSFRPNFLQATREHGLEEFFENYNVKSLRQLSKLISSIQHAVQIYICIYSGMRRSEIKALKIDALVRRSGTRAVLIQGICSKPKPFSTYWISSSEIIRPYEIATRLALRIGAEDEDVAEENMLFPSSLHLGFTSSLPKTTNYRLTLDSVRCTHEIYGYLDQSRLTTNSQDYKFLEKIDPFRDWSEDGRYQIDRPWRFAYHQFRRSLAY